MRTILVTGGAGFIGSNLVRYLLRLDEDLRVVNLDALTYAGSLESLRHLPHPERYEFVHGSVTDGALIRSILRDRSVSTVIHLAAESHVDRSIDGPGQFVETNIVGTYCLLEACRSVWTTPGGAGTMRGHFHHISTDEVFGSLMPEDEPFSESTPYAPSSPYAASKAASDHLVRAYAHTYGMRTTLTHCSNNYGPYQFPEKLIPVVILRALQGKTLPIYGDGRQVRDWLYVEDHCDAIWKVIQRGSSGETYNVGGDAEVANVDLVKSICRVLDERSPHSPHCPHAKLIEHVPDRPGHDRRYAINASKVRDEVGWEPAESLESGLRRTVQWYLRNAPWLDAIGAASEYQSWVSKNYGERK